jgi:Tol biopolymer transport system component/DNA-binding winged helix-turn-helix (wHTH) protein
VYTLAYSRGRMAEPTRVSVPVRFGNFEVSPDSGELRKNGARLKLSGQAIQVLMTLLERPGQIVTREELQQTLWPGVSFGDFEHGLNAAVNRLREVLGDSATTPRLIETVPRRGYRFIGQIEPESVQREASTPVAVEKERSSAREWLLRHGTLLLITAGLLLSLGIGVYVLLHRPRQLSEQLKIVPFTSYPGFEGIASFSPDGNQIVFPWHRGEMFIGDLYLKQIGSEHALRLTNHEAKFIVPAWSPDGRNIAFGMTGKDGNGVYLIPALGGRERQLAEVRDNNWQWLMLSWSQDSKWVAFSSDASGSKSGSGASRYRIHLVNVETAEERVVPEPAADCTMTMEPAFSPDGKHLASVCVSTLGVNKIYVQLINGQQSHEIAAVTTQFVLAGLTWTVDGGSIIYSTYGATGSLWRVPASGGNPEKLLSAHATQSPAVARAGRRLAYVQTNEHFDIWNVGLNSNPSTANPVRSIASSWDQAFPNFSPDGKLIAFVSNRTEDSEIWVCDRDGSEPVQLTSFPGPTTGSPRWSPDSRRLVFQSKVSGHAELYLVSVNGGRPQPLTTGTPNAESPFWSADGRWIFFATDAPDGIWRVPAEGGAAVRLTRTGTYPQESTDSTRVFYVVPGERSELWSVSVNGGDERREEGMPILVNFLSWTPAQKGIYFIDGHPSHLFVSYFDFASRRVKTVQQLHGISFICCGIAVSRDDKDLLFSGIGALEADIMLVEDFH